jgi:hypothetical protein
MMKLLGRTLVILLAALVVVGVAAGFGQSSFANSTSPRREAGFRDDAPPNFNQGEGTTGTNTSGSSGRPALTEGRGRPEGGQGINIFGMMDIVKNFVIVGGIVAVVALASAMVQRIRPRKAGIHEKVSPTSL